ncbi:MAG: MATE family efflux transporter, partial [Pyrinomonadaceae bacterium]|nr:MATE family efflux transporter [Pyrinomonadaceae bacterium]
MTLVGPENTLNNVTPDAITDQPNITSEPSHATAGMTKKVVKGSIWTLGGSILPVLVSLVATPFTLRLFGPENYGAVLLVGLIPQYFAFADLGMSAGSTVFASRAFGDGDREKESSVVWTAAAIALAFLAVVAIPLFIFAGPVIGLFNVPPAIVPETTAALRIATAAFVITTLAAVFNSPMLARIRMDLNVITQAGPRVLLSLGTPIVLYLGGGIFEAVAWSFAVAVIGFVLV